jgi:predicted dehydrogenase
MPAAMVLWGLQRALARFQPDRIAVLGKNGMATLAGIFCRQLSTAVDEVASTHGHRSPGAVLYVRASPRLSAIPSSEWTMMGDAPLLWLQSGPCVAGAAETELRESLRQRVEYVPIPDPWTECDLDVLGDSRLDLPAWASRPFLDETMCHLRDVSLDLADLSRPHGATAEVRRLIQLPAVPRRRGRSGPAVSVIGAGDFARSLLLPLLEESDVRLRGVVDLQPVRARSFAGSYGFAYCSTESDDVLYDPETTCVFIVTDHHSHAGLATKALELGKQVYLEKPPAVSFEQLRSLLGAMRSSGGSLQVGYNRRYAPLVVRAQELLANEAGPTTVHVNRRVYEVPANSWYYWPKEGTRIISNVCHFLDLAYYLCRSMPVSVSTVHGTHGRPDEHAAITATFEDGSLANVLFTRIGSPLEYVFVQRGSLSILVWQYARLVAYRDGHVIEERRISEDFGHVAAVKDFLNGCRLSRAGFYTADELAATTALSIGAHQSLEAGTSIDVRTQLIELLKDQCPAGALVAAVV